MRFPYTYRSQSQQAFACAYLNERGQLGALELWDERRNRWTAVPAESPRFSGCIADLQAELARDGERKTRNP